MNIPAKDYLERFPIQFDFTNALGGETVTSVTVSAEVESGVDADPNAILVGTSGVLDGVVTQWVGGGLIGTTYHIRCSIQTSTTRVLVAALSMPIVKR